MRIELVHLVVLPPEAVIGWSYQSHSLHRVGFGPVHSHARQQNQNACLFLPKDEHDLEIQWNKAFRMSYANQAVYQYWADANEIHNIQHIISLKRYECANRIPPISHRSAMQPWIIWSTRNWSTVCFWPAGETINHSSLNCVAQRNGILSSLLQHLIQCTNSGHSAPGPRCASGFALISGPVPPSRTQIFFL